ncbi:uncharacterized protein TNCV_137431 [Trichonephila clavipes]|nr:uncharacterized protein TNCV_137431 [Trichonephila clavipes]
MHSGDLFIEESSTKQALALASLKRLADFDIQVKSHATLNFSRGVITAADLYNVTNEEILENMEDQKVCEVRRITLRRDGQLLNTKHLILTFATPDLPQSFKRFGHPNPLLGQPTCAEVGHERTDCKAREKCVNCKGDSPSYSRSCPTWSTEKEITVLKIKNKIYPEARCIVCSHTPVSGKSYATAATKTTKTTAIQIDPVSINIPSSPTPAEITEKSKIIAVDTSKTVSTTSIIKKNRKTRIKESGVQAN